ncbi:hypothetical protein D3C75_750570 [compost metagenome]
MPFGQLGHRTVFISAHDKRQMYEYRGFPAEHAVQLHIQGGGGDILRAADHMGDIHQVVIHHIGQVVCRIAVRLDQNRILKLGVVDGDFAKHSVRIGRGAGQRILLADDIRQAFSQLGIHLCLGQAAAVTVIAACTVFALEGGETFFIAEAVIRMAMLHQLPRLLQVNILAFALHVGPAAASDIRAFIMVQPGQVQGIIDDLYSLVYQPFPVRILDPENEGAFLGLGQQIGIQCGSQVPDMHVAGRAWGKSGYDVVLHGYVTAPS